MVVVREGVPSPADYARLLEAVGWRDFVNPMIVARALDASLYSVVAEDEGDLVGFGRIVGDGASRFYLEDVAVHPAYQRRGVGTRIVEDLLDHLHRNAPSRAFVGLFASSGVARFYERFDFRRRGAGEPGMYRIY